MHCNWLIAPSLSARRAWIEILILFGKFVWFVVALRKESVDRNLCVCDVSLNYKVALRKESVDRNTSPHSINFMTHTSLSARRAWIEI